MMRRQRLVIGSLVPEHRRFGAGTDLVPDLSPDLRRGLAQRPGMLASDDRPVGIVVEIDQLVSPPDEHRLTRGQHDPHGRLETLGPSVDRSRVRLYPSPGTRIERTHRSAAGKAVAPSAAVSSMIIHNL